jgi:hemoglobin
MRTRLLVSSIVVSGALALVACGGKGPPKEPAITETISDAGVPEAAPPEPPAPKSLFERLGGKVAITAVVETFIKNVSADTKINKRFAQTKGARMEKFKQGLIDTICEASGGDCKYTGKTMKDAHKGMKIKEEEWNALLLDLKAALEEHKVGESEQNDLVAALGGMHDDIVEKKK